MRIEEKDLTKILELEKQNSKILELAHVNECFKKTTFEEILKKFAKTAKKIKFPLEIIENRKQIDSIYRFYDLSSENPSKIALIEYFWDCIDLPYQNPLNQILLKSQIPTNIIQTNKQREIAYQAMIGKK